MRDLRKQTEESTLTDITNNKDKEKYERDLEDDAARSKEHLKTGRNKEPLPYKHHAINLKLHLARLSMPKHRKGETHINPILGKINFSRLKTLTI